jgi:large subunit ribosomal protein L2
MAVKKYKPTTPARRDMNAEDTSSLTRSHPSKNLTRAHKSRSGRSTRGSVTMRRRGGGAKRRYRPVDFDLPPGTDAVVEAIEYDPNRSSHIALIRHADGSQAYVLAGNRLGVGDRIQAGEDVPVAQGNRMPLGQIPLGSNVYNVEVIQRRGGQLARGAGARARVTARGEDSVYVQLPSGEVRLIHRGCYATLGTVGNEQHQNVKVGNAGRNRRKGRRPSVRGKAMNPADHPMGGGEGLTKPGRLPRTPWGKPAIGKKTRHRQRGNDAIVRRRTKKRK